MTIAHRALWLAPLTLSLFLIAALGGCQGVIGPTGAGDDAAGDNGNNGGDTPGEDVVISDLGSDQYEVPSDPGTRTIQRLNSTEYDNTIRDLLGIDSNPSADFPTDDRGYGFDNIADVLSISPLLVEMYERTAEELIDEVMYVNDVVAETWYFAADGPDVTATTGGAYSSGGWNLWSNGTLTTVLEVPAEGEYRLQARAFGQQAGNETAQMSFVLDGAEVDLVPVEATSFTSYETTVTIRAGVREIGVGFTNDFYDPNSGLDRNLIVEGFSVEGPLNVMPADNPLRERILVCDLATDVQGCGREIISSFGRRAWRRPFTDAEVDRLMQFIDLALAEGDDAETGLKLALRAILLSPHFIFKVEIDPDPNAPIVHPLGDYELATDRMMDDPKAESLVTDYAGQWLFIRAIDEASPDVWYFPEWDEALREDMRTEARQVFRTFYLQEDQSMRNLLVGKETFLNERLANHYGVGGVTGDELQRVDLTGTARVGWLTQGALLTATSYATRTSPVRRGQWVLQNLLCREPPPPPPGVEGIPQENPDGLSLRERMELHRADPVCASCHVEMDAIGFAFENFDGVGAWRDTDEGWPIDPSGELPSGEPFSDSEELAALIADDPAFATCTVEKTFIYALGRGTRSADRPYLDDIAEQWVAGGHRLSDLVTLVVQSELFRLRRGTSTTQ